MLVSSLPGLPCAEELTLSRWQESSLGDPMHKLVLVEAGQLDLEGGSGGWLIIPNHLVFIPADRAFTIRCSAPTRLRVAHLDPADADWHHHGCWITAATALSKEMLAQAIRWSPQQVRDEPTPRLFFRTLFHLCQDWFSNPRILWVPAAKSDAMVAAVTYVRNHLGDASLAGVCAASGLSTRTFQRRCEQELGFTWRAFLREVRVMRAMELLARREHAIGFVAQATGFSSLGAFTTSFTQRIGLPPSEYRRRFIL